MRILLDANFPKTLEDLPNPEGITITRISGRLSDQELIEHAHNEGYQALVLLDDEMVSRNGLVSLAEKRNVVLICSATEDPFEAEVNLRHALVTLKARLDRGSTLLWLRKDGLRPST